MKIDVDPGRCVGSGMCVLIAPGVFDQDETEGTVTLRHADPPPQDRDAALDAARLCPVGAITATGA
ncbi:MAG: ferredoxin [Stackebrandtia sp.]